MAKSKKPKKESGLPVVIALVFFVLTTVGLGVFCYVLYSDQEGIAAAAEKEKQTAQAAAKQQKIAENKAKLYRLVIGIGEQDDRESLTGESKPGDDYVAELKKINDAITKKLATVKTADPTVPQLTAADVLGWAPDNENKLPALGPTKFVLDETAKALGQRELAKNDATGELAEYTAAV